MNSERERLLANVPGRDGWKHWGPYLSERQWGTVREDYSPYGTAWDYFPHDHARSRAYRWGEDGIAGFSDSEQHVCLSLALWNGRDPILKERLFGLNNGEGNHGEDVKEQYFYLDATPTHSYLKMLYKYPQRAFPYTELVAENARRGTNVPEYELLDTDAFAEDRYFDVFVEYAQAEPCDILMKITAWNRGPEAALLHLIPQLVLRNTWSWEPGTIKPLLRARRRCRHRHRARGTCDQPPVLRRQPAAAVHRERDQCAQAVELRRRRVLQGWLSREDHRCARGLREPRHDRHQGRCVASTHGRGRGQSRAAPAALPPQPTGAIRGLRAMPGGAARGRR